MFQDIQKTSFILIVSYTSLTMKSNKIIQKRSKANQTTFLNNIKRICQKKWKMSWEIPREHSTFTPLS